MIARNMVRPEYPEGEALIVSFSELEFDSRVRRSVRELQQSGFSVTLIGFNATKVSADANFDLPPRTLYSGFKSLIALGEGVAKGDFNLFYYSRPWVREFEKILGRLLNSGRLFDVAILHDWEPLPPAKDKEIAAKMFVDCHEYTFDENHPGILKRSLDQYKRWLIQEHFDSSIGLVTVNQEMSSLYQQKLNVTVPVISNSVTSKIGDVQKIDWESPLSLVYQGALGTNRGLGRLAFLALIGLGKYRIHLFLTGTHSANGLLLRLLSAILVGLDLHKSLDRETLIRKLTTYDFGIYLHPNKTLNAKLALPNKLFEWTAAELPVVTCGESLVGDLIDKTKTGVLIPKNVFLQRKVLLGLASQKKTRDLKRYNLAALRSELSRRTAAETDYKHLVLKSSRKCDCCER